LNPLSILFVDQYREVAGGQVVLQALVKNAKEKGFEVGVLAPLGGGLEAVLVSRWSKGIALHDLKQLNLQDGRKGPRDLFQLIAYCFYVLSLWRVAAHYNVIYVNGCRVAPAFMLLSFFLPRHSWFYHMHLCHSRVEKLIFTIISLAPSTHRIVMASSYIRDDLFRSVPWLAKNRRFVVLENCLGPVFEGLPPLDRFKDDNQPLTVALIGRVSPEKGHDVLPRLARRFPSVRFLIIGRTTSEHRCFLDSLLSERLPNLSYLGETSELPKLLEEQHVQFSIVPSRWEEPFGLTSIESMAASCITLVSNKGMLPMIADRTGALCFEDDNHLERLLERLFALDLPALKLLERKQYDGVHAHFDGNTFCWKFISMIRATTKSPSPRNCGAIAWLRSVVHETINRRFTLPPLRALDQR
jgi:glycosyltransferase involved in cell wall biosynthesis